MKDEKSKENQKKVKKQVKDQKEMNKEKKVSKLNPIIKFNILAAICIIIISLAVTPKTLQNDTFYTIKVGEAITTYGVDMQEHFSWHEGLKYTYPHWLYDLATYQIYNHFGFDGIYGATLMLSSVLGLALYFTNSKLSKNNLISLILTGFEMVALSPYITARAQLVSFILFVFTNYFIEEFIETKKKRYAIGLLIIPIIIANVHAAVFPFYFVFFIPAIVEYLFAIIRNSCFIEKIIVASMKDDVKRFEKRRAKYLRKGHSFEDYDKKHEELEKQVEKSEGKLKKIQEQIQESEENPYKFKLKKNDNVKWLILIAIIAGFAGLLTPIGDTPYTYLIHTMQGNTTTFISEHLPMTLFESPQALIEIGLILALLLLFKTKINLRDGFMLCGMCLLMLATRRQFSIFTIIAVIVIAKLLKQLFDKYDPEGTDKAIEAINTIPGKVFVLCLVLSMGLIFYKDKKDAPYVDSATYPVKAVDYIKQNLLGTEDLKLFNGYDYGSYLLFNDIPVFIDSRADVYDPKFNGLSQDIFTDAMNITSISVYYENKFEEYGINYVMSYRNTKLVMLLLKDKNYKLEYYDDNFVIFKRLNANDTNKEENKDNVSNENNSNEEKDDNRKELVESQDENKVLDEKNSEK